MMRKKWLPHILAVMSLVVFVVLGLASDGTTPPPPPSGGGGGQQTGGSTPTRQTRELRRDFTTAGQHTFTFNEGFPATVHVYMVGAGGGGQGGFTKAYQQGLGTRTEHGTGAPGGGGAVLYTSFEITAPTTFNIAVGAGGAGGARHHRGVGGSWEAGRPGAAGGNTTVSAGSLNLTALAGSGGGGSGSQNVAAGRSGAPSSRPSGQTGLLTWTADGGLDGSNGGHNADLRPQQNQGRPGQIPAGNGPVVFGRGSMGAGSGAGNGGAGGYSETAGNPGAPGRVLFVVTYPQ